jgi:hypothetical protein
MQTINLRSYGRHGQLPDPKTSMRLRAFRYLSERYAKRERPIDVATEFSLFALIVLTATWPMFTLAHALGLGR